jgi:two-component system, NtrC family, sensor kinase
MMIPNRILLKLYLLLLGSLFFLFSPKGYAQNNKIIPHFTSEMIKGGILPLDIKDAWKYQQGDDLSRANPNFDEAQWLNITPWGLRADNLPDSLWKGYGWWRITFTADSTFYTQISRLYFRSWGAAEVYLDGVKIHNYGFFSTQSNYEKNYIPRLVVDKPLQITSKSFHVLAVRYSNHQARSNQALLKHNAPNLGFNIGFANEWHGIDSERNYAYGIAAFAIISAILLLLFLLNLLLFFKFPKEESNLIIAFVIASFLISTITNYTQIFLELTGFWNSIFRGFINSTFYGLGLVLIPYTLSLIFQLKNFYWTKYLVWLVIIRVFCYFFPFFPIIFWDSAFIFLIFSVIAFLMYQAIKSKKPSVHYVTVGAILTSVFVLIDRLYATAVIDLSTESFYLVLIILFISFPVGLSAYVASQYGTLFFFMEQEVATRTSELNQSLETLRATQTQLIQSEKLASLGELTAGIAHEIQNPLNFVNNFSELSVDLVKDLKDEMKKTDMDKEYIEELFTDLSQNQEKISHHGKRASSIVKGMLEHSRTSTGVKELTDINKLADEYLRLSYHGLRAKDKTFNADFTTDFDEKLPKINVITQDLGRVLLNLINNAFYAVNERRQNIIARNEATSNYTPSVSVSTQLFDNQIIIKVADNGTGMPESVKAKIFQPFFTTKPTGQGTGLGLSLAYDIVTKGHGGTLEVKSTFAPEGDDVHGDKEVGTTFTIQFPLSNLSFVVL